MAKNTAMPKRDSMADVRRARNRADVANQFNQQMPNTTKPGHPNSPTVSATRL